MEEATKLGKADLGEKLTCSSCGARFYDLNKSPAECPKCGAENARPKVFKSKKAETTAKPVKESDAPKKASDGDDEDVEDIEEIEDVEDEDDDLLNDDDDLDDDDDVGSVIGPIDSDKESDI